MTDEFGSLGQNSMTPTEYQFDVTPDDATDLERVTKAIHLGTAGDVRVTGVDNADDTFVTLRNVPAGVPYPIRAKRIWAAGTTANDIVGLA